MTFLTIAFHHLHPDHVDAFADYARRVMAATEGAEGLIEFTSWLDTEHKTLIGHATWESEEAFRNALSRIGSLRDERRPEWSVRDDEVMTFTQL
jgi:heme-degrading monooxygenase HmoA